jgi:hypothetical protein
VTRSNESKTTWSPHKLLQIQRLSRKLQQANFKYWISRSDGKSVECKVDCIVLHRDAWDLILAETCDRLSGNCDLDSMKLLGLPVYVEADNDAVWKKAAREFLHQYNRVLVSTKSDAGFDLAVLNNWMFRHMPKHPWKIHRKEWLLGLDSFPSFIRIDRRF